LVEEANTTDFDLTLEDKTPINIIDETTNNNSVEYYEQSEYTDCEIKGEADSIHNMSDVETRQSTSQVKKKSKINIFVCDICNRAFTQVKKI